MWQRGTGEVSPLLSQVSVAPRWSLLGAPCFIEAVKVHLKTKSAETLSAYAALSVTAPSVDPILVGPSTDAATTSGRTFEAAQRSSQDSLYPSHVKLGTLQKATVAVLSAIGASLK